MAVPNGVGCWWVGTNAAIATIPGGGWSRDTTIDTRFVKMIATSATNPGTTGGSTTHPHTFGGHGHAINHSHTFTGSGVPSATGTSFPPGGAGTPATNHTHGMSGAAFCGTSSATSASWANATSEPAQLTVIAIKSDGTPAGFPNNALVYYNGAAPAGWTRYAAGDNRLLKGAAAGGDGGGTADTSVHTHTGAHTHPLPAHQHTLTLVVPGSGGASTAGATANHVHSAGLSTSTGATCSASASPASGNGDTTPPWSKMLLIQNTSGSASLVNGLIGWWGGTIASIPTSWKITDGTSGTPNMSSGVYVRNSDTVGNIGTTGGTATHNHPGANHTHTSGGVTHQHARTCANSGASRCYSTSPGCACGGACSSPAGHTHALSATLSSAVDHGGLTCAATGNSGNANNDPLNITVAYIQYTNSAPGAPTITLPVAGSVYSGTITLSASAVDPDGDQITMDFEWNVGGGGFTLIGTSGLVNSGAPATLAWNTDPRARDTTYQVRARAKDPSGTGTFGPYTTTGNFTIDYLPVVGAIFTPVAGSAYSSLLTLDATVSDADAGQTVTTTWEYSANNGGSWSAVPGVGSAAPAAGGHSTLSWNITALVPGIQYKVRVTPKDSLGVIGAVVTLAGTFIVGPSTSAIFAAPNTAAFYAQKNTAAFLAVANTVAFYAQKG